MANKLLRVEVYSHHYTVKVCEQRAMYLMDRFLRKYSIPVFGKKGKIEDFIVYASVTKDKTEYRLHINTLIDFKFYLEDNYISKEQVEVHRVPAPVAVMSDMRVKEGWVPRDYQEPYIDYLTADDNVVSKLVGLQTGKGKTFIALYSLTKLGMRSMIYVLPKYIDKWVSDCTKVLDIQEERILVIRKGSELRYALQEGKDKQLDVDIIIISNRIYKNYIKEFNLVTGDKDMFSYPSLPEEFHEDLGVGVTIIDEVHQEFYNTFTYMLHSHLYRIIALSATFETMDKRLSKMYYMAFPSRDRYVDRNYDKYIDVVAVEYEFHRPQFIKYKDYRLGAYSHIVFEQSIMRNKKTLDDYLDMIFHTVNIGYYKRKRVNDGCIIFVATIKMATLVKDYMSKKYPELDVRRYVEDDPYENVIEADIKVSTIQSSGTAIDIPNLITVVQTVNIQSYQANVQTVGRLRKIEGFPTVFYYLWCNQIDKHVEYHKTRQETFKPKVKTLIHERYPKPIGKMDSKYN